MNHKEMEIAQITKYIICKQISTVHSLSSQYLHNNINK